MTSRCSINDVIHTDHSVTVVMIAEKVQISIDTVHTIIISKLTTAKHVQNGS